MKNLKKGGIDYFVGGMPEAVQSFVEIKDFNEARDIQKRRLAVNFPLYAIEQIAKLQVGYTV